jgi:hypothetical protein
MFSQSKESKKYPNKDWIAGKHTFQLYVRSSDRISPFKAIEFSKNIDEDTLAQYANRGSSYFVDAGSDPDTWL